MGRQQDPAAAAYFAKVRHIREQLGDFPVHTTLPDPTTGSEFTYSKERFASIMTIDVESITLDAQTLPRLYVECSRARRGAERAAASADAFYRVWKASKVKECFATWDPKDGKKPTAAQQEAYYRTQDDYERISAAGDFYRSQAGFWADMMSALRLKASMIEVIDRRSWEQEAWMKLSPSEDSERMVDYSAAYAAAHPEGFPDYSALAAAAPTSGPLTQGAAPAAPPTELPTPPAPPPANDPATEAGPRKPPTRRAKRS